MSWRLPILALFVIGLHVGEILILGTSPAGALTMNGLQTSGMIHKDQQGNYYYYYPGVGAAVHALTATLGHFGIPVSLPISVPFTGELKYTIPGIANPVTPSTGPFVSIPLKALASIDPAFFRQVDGADTRQLGNVGDRDKAIGILVQHRNRPG